MPSAISVSGLSKSFGRYSILDDCSLEIGEGEVYGLVGLNGAGKTTLIRLLAGVLKADRGALSVLGRDPWSHEASFYRRAGIVLEHDGFWGNLDFRRNMRIFAAAKGVAWSDARRYLEEFWGGTDICRSRKAVKFFSRGMRMQCALCRAFLGWPSVYFFDEPAIALDVGAYDHFAALVRRARGNGAAVIISSHQLNAIDDLAGRAGMLRGRKLTELLRGTGRGEVWSVGADRNAAWAAVIKEVCGSEPSWDNGEWRFEVTDPQVAVPVLVRRLVEAGCSIGRAAPLQNDFSEVIRREYRGTISSVKGEAE
ncbi:MAG: ABC transporter ATP-binding protein [Chitinispirillaceae bacterium]|nr:ABC transporter ATP-binding protein [Chitinispirillaceae bacterium]